MHSKTVR